MKRRILILAAAVLGLVPLLSTPTPSQTRHEIREQAMEHPRIVRAITDLEDAIAYLQSAPDIFGGHKAAAIRASEKAVEELRKALAYRARQER